jgi:hypothetical protein
LPAEGSMERIEELNAFKDVLDQLIKSERRSSAQLIARANDQTSDE